MRDLEGMTTDLRDLREQIEAAALAWNGYPYVVQMLRSIISHMDAITEGTYGQSERGISNPGEE